MTKSPHPSSVDKGELLPVTPTKSQLERARQAAASIRPYSHNSALILDGERDGTDVVQAALAAILNEVPPCAKCGSEASVYHYHGIAINGWAVECDQDNDTGDGSHGSGRYDTRDQAVAAWKASQAHSLPGDVGMREALAALETGWDDVARYGLSTTICCSGEECACQGTSLGQYLAHELRAALTPSALSGDAGEARAWPKALTQGLREILGIPNFQCGPMAHAYQRIGEFSGDEGLALEKRAEDEQAFILHKLVSFWFEHGDAWREPAIDEIDRAAKLARAASQQGTEP